MFCRRGVRARHGRAGVLARDRRAARDERARRRRTALVSLVRRNRRRYGGYLVHLGIAVLFVGVAASTAFEHERDVRLTPGETTTVGDYEVTYVKRDRRHRRRQRAAASRRSTSARCVEVRARRRAVATLAPERGYYPSQDVSGSAMSAASSRARRRARSGSTRAACGRRLDRRAARRRAAAAAHREGRRAVRGVRPAAGDPSALQAMFLGRSLGGLVERYVEHDESAGAVPPDRLAARELDLDRRAHHVRRRADRAVAGAGRGAPPRHRPRRRARRAGPRPRR